MKKQILYSGLAACGVLLMSAGCTNNAGETDNTLSPGAKTFGVTLNSAVTRVYTEESDGGHTPKWHDGDKLGVFTTGAAANFNKEFNVACADGHLGEFKGQITGTTGDYTFYAVHPMSGAAENNDLNAYKTEIPNIQAPEASTIDCKAYLAVAKPVGQNIASIDNDVVVDGLQFKRLNAMMRLDFAVGDDVNGLSGASVKKVTFAAPQGVVLTGEVNVDIENNTLGTFTKGYNNVVAGYTDGAVTVGDGGFSTWVMVNPVTLGTGQEFTVTVEFSDPAVAYERTCTVGDRAIELNTNKLVPITLALDNFTKASVIPAGYDLYIAGDAAAGIPEGQRKLTTGEGGSFVYDKVVNGGELYFLAKKEGADDIEFYVAPGNNAVSRTAAPGYSVVKSFHTITVDPMDGAFSAFVGLGIGDALWMHALHVNYPRFGTHEVWAELPVWAQNDNPFVFEICNRFYHLDYKDDAYKGFSFFLEPSHSNHIRIYDAGDGKIGIGAENDWKLTTTSDLRIKIDLLNKTYDIEPITLYPDNIQGVWIFGNNFSAEDYWGYADKEAALRDTSRDDFSPSMIDRYSMGLIYSAKYTKMEQNGSVYTITADLRADLGGFWFILREKGSLPSLINDGSGNAVFYGGDPTNYSDRDSTDALIESHWHIEEDGNYTITLDINTNQVDIVKNY